MTNTDLYKLLGAEYAKKIVLKAEKIKYKFISRVCPNITSWYNKKCDKACLRRLSKVECEEEKKKIRLEYNFRKMAFSKEYAEGKNRNYHINYNSASEFKEYINWNRDVHKKGMIKDGIVLGLSIPFIILGNFPVVALSGVALGVSLVSLGIDFECFNLQNYTLERLKENEATLKKIEDKSKARDAEKYALVGKKVYENMQGNVAMPNNIDFINDLDKEELIELKNLLLEVKRTREKESNPIVLKKRR